LRLGSHLFPLLLITGLLISVLLLRKFCFEVSDERLRDLLCFELRLFKIFDHFGTLLLFLFVVGSAALELLLEGLLLEIISIFHVSEGKLHTVQFILVSLFQLGYLLLLFLVNA